MKKFGFYLILFLIHFCASSQDSLEYWKRGGLASLNLNQVSFTNWSAGGDNSFSATALLNSFFNYQRERVTWENSIDFGYGVVKLGSTPLRKNEDRLIINSKYGKQMFDKVYFSTLLNFRSQFAPGYNYPNDSVKVSGFFAPAFVIASVGFDLKPKSFLSVYASPVTGKFTIVKDQVLADQGAYGVDSAHHDGTGKRIVKGKNLRSELGAYVSVKFEKNIMENITLKSRLDLFNNYSDKNKGNRKNIDVNWETNLNMKVNKYISVTLFTHLIYDNDILVPLYTEVNGVRMVTGKGRRIQFKEVLGIGFSYKF